MNTDTIKLKMLEGWYIEIEEQILASLAAGVPASSISIMHPAFMTHGHLVHLKGGIVFTPQPGE